jgi:Flp pilus assembly protein TadD
MSGLNGKKPVLPSLAARSSTFPNNYSPFKPQGNSFTSALRRGVQTATNAVTPKPKIVPAYDVVSLAHKTARPGAALYVSSGRMLESRGDIERAMAQYKKALDIDPANRSAILSYARALDRRGKMAEAMHQYHVAIKHHPNDAAAHNDLGLCYARQDRFRESLRELETAIRLAPEKPLYRNNAATVLVQLGRPNNALRQLMVHGEPAVAHYNVGYLLIKKGDRQQAAAHFSKAVQADPSMPQAKMWLAQLGGNIGTSPAATTPARPVHNTLRSPAATPSLRLPSGAPDRRDSARSLIQNLPPVSAAYQPRRRW